MRSIACSTFPGSVRWVSRDVTIITAKASGTVQIAGWPSANVIKIFGFFVVLTALVAWYTSAAVVVNNMAGRPVLPVGRPMWAATAGTAPAAPAAARA